MSALIPVVGFYTLRYHYLPSKSLIGIVFFGSQFPDLIDKPLAHMAFILPSGRVFMHSLPFAIPICILVVSYAVVTDRPMFGGGFVFAYLCHLLGDSRQMLLAGEVPPDLFWPLMKPLPRPVEPFWAGPNGIYVTAWTVFSILVLSVTLTYLAKDISIQLADIRA